jgi:TatD family-associated radical SAM protein
VTQKISYQIGNSLYLSITDRCTLVCTFCPKTLGNTTVQGYDLSMDHRPSVEEIISAIDNPIKYDEVVFCGYGEPTLRLNVLLEVARTIKAAGGKTRINSDGLANLVHRRNTLPEMADCIDALSISMNAQDKTTYDRHTQPTLPDSYDAMLAFLTEAPKHIAQVTATALDGLEGVDIAACEKLAEACGVHFRKRTLGRVG